MTILVEMKAARLQARRDRDSSKSATLGTIIGDIEMVGKNASREPSDAEAVTVLKKYIKNAEESLRVAGDYRDGDAADRINKELSIYQMFLPKQLTRDELIDVIKTIADELGVETPKGKGVLMKTLKERFEGLYDGATAAAVAGEVLKPAQA